MSDPLWERLLIAATGPAVTAVLALLVINQVTTWAQQRKDGAEARETLATELTHIANSLYLALQSFWRSARNVPLADRMASAELEVDRQKLQEAYLDARVSGQVLEQRLRIYYADPEPARLWHRVNDLLTVRYFLLLEGDEARRSGIRRKNAGPEHSGLDERQLRDPALLLETFRQTLDETVLSLWAHGLDRRGRHIIRTESSAAQHSVESGV